MYFVFPYKQIVLLLNQKTHQIKASHELINAKVLFFLE